MVKQIKSSTRVSLLILSIVMIVIDQITKYVVRSNLFEYQMKPFLPSWNWVLVYNKGAAFSFLGDQSGWQKVMFGLIALVVSIGIVYYLLRKNYQLISGFAFSLILAGAVGNLIDRLIAGKVTDFIDWYVGTHHWPAFNFADSCISVGVALLIIESLFFTKKA